MAQNFQIVGRLALQGPQNIRAVVRQLQTQLNSVKANVQLNIPTNVNTKLNTINTNLQRIDANLRSIRQSGLNAAQALQQLASALGTIRTNAQGINVTLKNLNNVSKAASNAASSMSSFGGQAGLAVRRFLAFAAPTSIFLALVAAIKSGVKEAIDFEKEMVRLSQVTGRSVASLSDLSGEITRLATGLGTSSKELSSVAVTLAQAGLNAKDTKSALEALARSSLAATFDDINQTTEGAIAVFRQFGVGAKDLQGVIGSLNAVSAQFAVESDDLVSAIRRTGGAFKVSGGNLNELLGLFTSVRATTRESADSIATGFRTIFTRIQRPRTIQFLKELGVELQNAKGQFIGPVEAVRRLNLALQDIATTDPRFAAVIEELGGFRQVSKVIPLIQQFPEALKAISVAEQGQLSIVEDSITAQKSLANQIVKVREEFLALFRELSSDKSFQFFAKTTLEIASNLIKVTQAIKPLIPLLGSLALIGVGRGIGSVSSNFASALGGRKRFARGGVVPGSGSGDTVPALLEPGEFVVNKKSAKAIGFQNLARANKFAKGGVARKFGIAALLPPGVDRTERFPVRTDALVGGKKQTIEEDIELSIATPSKRFASKTEDIIRHQVGKAASSVAVGIQQSIGAKGSAQPANLNAILKKAGFDSVVGHIFEASLALAGAPFSEHGGTSLDFPNGLGEVARIFGNNFPANVGTDAKRTADSHDFKRRNLITFLRSEAIARAGVTTKSTLPTTPNSGASLSTIKPGTKLTAQQLGILLGSPGLKFKQLSELPQVKAGFTTSRAGGASTFIKKALGGSIPGSGNNDTVPALLTPGEFVINKQSAAAIGIGNLNRINKFASGGQVPKSGGSGAGGALVATSALQLFPALFGLEEESSKLLRTFTAMGIAATATTFGLRALASEEKLAKANRIFNAPGRVGLGGGSVSRNDPRVIVAGFAANLDKLGIGIGLASGALATFGQGLQDSAISAAKLATSQQELDKAITEDKRGSAFAGAGTGAGVGAAIGTIITPGIGTAIGAAAGAAIGTVIGAINNNQKELIKAFRQSKFDKVSEKLDTVFDEFSSGRITRPSAALSLRSSLSSQISNIRGTSDLEQRGELTKQFRGNLVNIRTFSQAIAGQVSTINEFENAFGGTGKVLIESISLLTKKSLPDVRKEIENEIQAHKKVSEAANKRAKADKEATVLTISIRTFADALQNVTDSLNRSQNVFDNIEALSSGGSTSGKFNNVSAGFFGRAAAGSISNSASVSSAVRSLTGPLGASSSKAIEETAVSVAKLTNILPDILERVAAGTGIGGDTERASELFEKEIDNLDGVSESLKNVVKSIFGSELASRQGGGESGAIQNIREDLLGLVNKLVPEAIRKSVEVLDEVNKNLQEQMDLIGKRLIQQSNLEFSISKQKVSLEEKIFDITKSRLKEGERLTFGQVQASANKRRNEILPGAGGVGFAGSRLIDLQKEVQLQNDIINSDKSSLEQRAKANKRLVELGAESNRLREYLKDLAESTQELTHLQEELARTEADRKSGRSLVEGLLFGEGKDRVAFSKFTKNALEISSGKKNIGSLGPQQRGEFLDFLEKLPQNKTLGLLGGLNVEDFKKDQLRKSFITRAGAEGADVGAASNLINELTSTTKAEDEIRKQLIGVQNTQIDAIRALIDADNALEITLDKLNNESLANLPKAIQAAIAESAIAGLSTQASSIRNQVTEKQQNVSNLGTLLGDFGVNLEQANLIKNQESRFRELIKNNKELTDIRGISLNTDDAASELRKRAGGKNVSVEDINAVVTPLLQTINSPEIRDQLERQILDRFKNNPSSSFSDISSNLRGSVANFKSSRIDILSSRNRSIEGSLSNVKQFIPKFSDENNLNDFTSRIGSLDTILSTGKISVDEYAKGIQALNRELINIQNKITSLRPTPVPGRAGGGLINGKGISSPLVRFSPMGSDTVPAMLTAGEFVVNRGATSANLPLLQAINAGGFASGGRISPLRARSLKRIEKTRARVAARQERIAAAQDRKAVLEGRAAFAQSRIVPGRALIGQAATDVFDAEKGAVVGGQKFDAEAAQTERRNRFNGILFDMQGARLNREKEIKRIKEEMSRRVFARAASARGGFGGGGFAMGGPVPGSGTGDTVPALLTPGEFVLNKRAVRALGMSTLSSFNKRFAAGGPVQASGSGGGSITLDSASISALDNFNKAAANLSRFAETNTMLATALSTWSNSASKLSEAMSSFPSEVQVNHSPIILAVNVSGMEGLEENIQSKIMKVIDERLGQQKAKASDGKSPFFAGR